MKVFFLSKKGGMLIGIYIMAFCLLAAGTGIIMPDSVFVTGSADTVPQPWRCGSEDSHSISLAINVDWGEEYIPQILDALGEHNIHATFFLTGRWCDNNQELARNIAMSGHELGNHGYSHRSPNASAKEEIKDEIKRTEDAVLLATGYCTSLYAPPSGECEDHVLQAAAESGYQTILWSVDTIDWQKPDADTIIKRVEDKIHGGAIILAHPTASTAEALPTIIDDLQEKGYEFVTVSQNLDL